MFLHYSCVDRTANLQFYRHACRAARGHPHSLSSHSKRCTYTNNIQSVNLWKSQIYFYKQHGLHCSSWEQKKPAKDTTHRNKRVWMSSVLSLQTSHQTHQTGSLRPHLERQLKHDVCGMREIYICECRHRSYFSPDIWLQMEPTEKNQDQCNVHNQHRPARNGCKPSELVIKWILTTLLPTRRKRHSRLCP